jgi:uncharacterized protein YndB with AHSA1/START domain
MPDIRHRVVVKAPAGEVYAAVAEPKRIAEWWTRDGVTGEGDEGSELRFFFGSPDPAAVMAVARLEQDRAVGWRCVGGADEWVGTDLAFELKPADDGTAVLFTHAGWRSASEFMAHCSARWAYFLLSMKALVETGTGTPFPEDLKF